MQKLGIGLSLFGVTASLILAANVFAARDDTRGFGMTGRVFPKIATTSGRLRVCQVHELVIKNRSMNLTRRANDTIDVFDKIAKRVEDFYTNKVLPGGTTVSNYSSLVADIQTKEALVKTDLQIAQNDANSFNCNNSDPKGQLTTFRQDMQKVIDALKDFRTSIRNLIVAVHGAVGDRSASASARFKPATGSGESNE